MANIKRPSRASGQRSRRSSVPAKKDRPIPIAGRDDATRDDWDENTKNTSVSSRLSEFKYDAGCKHCVDNSWRHTQVNKLLGQNSGNNGN
jgi:hypothetical protein